MSKRTKIILLIAIALLILGMAFFPAIKNLCNADTLESASFFSTKKPSLNVNAQILKYQSISDNFRTKGILIPDEEVNLSFETSGKITHIYFSEGSSVKKGDLLAKVNDEPLQAELKKLTAQVPLAQDRVSRQKTLLEKDAVSQEAYESVSTELEKLRADIELVKARIAQTELRAPFDGVIGLRFVSEGAYVSPTSIVSKLTKISPLKIEFSVNERQANDIKVGTNIDFTVETGAEIHHATVYAVESHLDAGTLSLKARAIYHNSAGKLKPGQSASLEVKMNEIRNALIVPSIASLAEMGRDLVYVYENGKARQMVVQKGIRTASSVQITGGLQVGDTVIVSGIMQLRDDMEVNIVSITN
ncbi:MexH family multidrug efflux RND transporter periplasmic adaptor subunit [Bacteroidia bacterium]|nr:MexH family multidrug efflux RND transporter periplasmic adaptor subunit [Bacteroidia bacterium]